MGSPLILKDPPKSSTPYKRSDDIQSQDETGTSDDNDDDESDEWMSAANYHFIDVSNLSVLVCNLLLAYKGISPTTKFCKGRFKIITWL